MSESTEDIRLARLDAGRQALAEATSIPEVKEIHDKANAIRLYFRQQRGSFEAQNSAAELKLRAERRLGELLAERKADLHPVSRERRLPDGITHIQSHRWQRAASLPEPQFEAYVADTKPTKDLLSSDVQRLVKQRLLDERHATWAQRPSPTSIVSQLDELMSRGQRFGTIYADPPWRYSNQATRSSTDKNYQTMTVETIAAMPIKQVAEDDSHLHLWTTNGFLFEAKTILEAWGFEYKSCFVWVKHKMGIGNYWRVSHEFLLLGIRGTCPFQDHSIMSWFSSKPKGHSQKPEAIRTLIERASPPARLELFGRRAVKGWTVLGNEIAPTMFDDDGGET